MPNNPELIPELSKLVPIARRAGQAIMDVYQSDDFDVEVKGDGSPLTRADLAAHRLITTELEALTPEIPVVSEENYSTIGEQRLNWPSYWLVDPLDGTKEFIKRNGEFTVNIALIEHGKPVIGVVYAPALDTCYFASTLTEQAGAFKQIAEAPAQGIQCRDLNPEQVTVVASRSHASPALQDFLDALEQAGAQIDTKSMGSSLKLCLVAEGAADYYPRLAPTSEWDTAAAHCVVEAAGGQVVQYLDLTPGEPLRYSKADILNPWFLVAADLSAIEIKARSGLS